MDFSCCSLGITVPGKEQCSINICLMNARRRALSHSVLPNMDYSRPPNASQVKKPPSRSILTRAAKPWLLKCFWQLALPSLDVLLSSDLPRPLIASAFPEETPYTGSWCYSSANNSTGSWSPPVSMRKYHSLYQSSPGGEGLSPRAAWSQTARPTNIDEQFKRTGPSALIPPGSSPRLQVGNQRESALWK